MLFLIRFLGTFQKQKLYAPLRMLHTLVERLAILIWLMAHVRSYVF